MALSKRIRGLRSGAGDFLTRKIKPKKKSKKKNENFGESVPLTLVGPRSLGLFISKLWTQFMGRGFSPRVNPFVLVFSILFLTCIGDAYGVLKSKQGSGEIHWGRLEVRSEKWVKVSINGLPGRYTPVDFKKLRPGRYKIQWESQKEKGEREVLIKGSSPVRLQL